MNTRPKSRKSLRRAVCTLLTMISLAVAASPVSAASGVGSVDRGALAMIVAFALLLFGIVIEVWRYAARAPEPARNRATSEWKPHHRH